VACLAGFFAAGRFYRRIRRDWRSGYSSYQGWPGGGYARHQYGHWPS
jgi:hypothetical protein